MKNKAFTLIEVVVAIGVLSIGVLAIASFFANSSVLSKLASNKSVASILAQGYLDEEIALSYDELPVGQTTKTRISDSQTSPFYNFYKQADVDLIDSNLNDSVDDLGLKKIVVVISYQEGSHEKSVSLATIKTKK